ncbi:hypothetical protein HOY82DRAFT_458225, partial [Tuber indicum]
LPKPTSVYLGDGSPVFATGFGNITLTLFHSSITIKALYVPDLTYNLLSVSCLSTERRISFSNNCCYIKHGSSDEEQLAILKDGLYHVMVE